MLFNGLRLLVTNWRLMLVQVLPAMWVWAATIDLKAHVLHGKEFDVIRGPLVVVVALFAAVILITIAAFYLNASFAFAISRPGPPDLQVGFRQARKHLRAVIGWGTSVGLALVCYVAVPARIIGAQTSGSAKTAMSGRAAKLAESAVTGLFGAIVCPPPYALARGGILLLGSSTLFPIGVVLLIVGLMLEAGATGAVKAIKVSAKLLAGRDPESARDLALTGSDARSPSSTANSA